MARTQNFPIGDDFKAEVVQRNLEDLFQAAHEHDALKEAPRASDGVPGDMYPVQINGVFYIYVKFPEGWKRAVLS